MPMLSGFADMRNYDVIASYGWCRACYLRLLRPNKKLRKVNLSFNGDRDAILRQGNLPGQRVKSLEMEDKNPWKLDQALGSLRC